LPQITIRSVPPLHLTVAVPFDRLQPEKVVETDVVIESGSVSVIATVAEQKFASVIV